MRPCSSLRPSAGAVKGSEERSETSPKDESADATSVRRAPVHRWAGGPGAVTGRGIAARRRQAGRAGLAKKDIAGRR